MSNNSSIQRLPVEVDPFRLVEQGRKFEGRIPLGDFPRLQDLLFDTNNELVTANLEFTRTETGLPVIKGQIKVELQMICNRCLGSTEMLVEINPEVVFVSSDAQAERLQDSYDVWLVEDQKLFLRDFIEDELLLAMPIVIAHEADEECQPARSLIEALPDDENRDENDEKQQKKNPFAVLKDLKLN
jgi:uncharacterized protein